MTLGGRKRKARRSCGAWALAGLLLLGAGVAHADPPPAARNARELVIVNTSARAIEQLYVSPSNSEQWGEDWLSGDTLAAGASFGVRVPRSGGCTVDVQVVYADSQREERRTVDLCRTRQLAFDGTGATEPEDGVRDHALALNNRARRAITQIFLSGSDADQWGDNRLGVDPLAIGKSRDITFHGGCLADMRVVFDNRAAEERRGIDLCSQSGVIVRPGWTTDDRVPGSTDMPAAPAAPAPEIVTLLVDNRSGAPVTAITMRPEDRPVTPAMAREPAATETRDLLGGVALPAGGHVVMPVTRGRACRYTVRLVHGTGVPDQTLPGFDLCTMHDLVLPPIMAVR